MEQEPLPGQQIAAVPIGSGRDWRASDLRGDGGGQ